MDISDKDQVAFAIRVSEKPCDGVVVIAQVQNNPRDQAMKAWSAGDDQSDCRATNTYSVDDREASE